MKLSFLKKMTILFVAGLMLCGIGIGVSIAEVNDFEYVKNKSNNEYKNNEELFVNLPSDGSPLYYEDMNNYREECKKFEIKPDSSVSMGQIKYVVSHNGLIDNINVNVSTDKFIYDRDNLFISEHKVNFLEPVNYEYNINYKNSNDPVSQIKDFFNNFKNKKIVEDTNNVDYIVTIYVNPEDMDRLIKLQRYQQMITYREYLDNYKSEIDAYRNNDTLVEEAD